MKKTILFGLFILMAAGTVAGGNLAGLDVDRGYQRSGSDYDHYHADNAKSCASDCSRDNRCKAFDYDTHQRTCWLKNSVPAIRRNAEIVTGKKPQHDYNYGHTASGGQKATARGHGYCLLSNRDSGQHVFDSSCDVRQTVTGNKQVFAIVFDNGTKYRFVQKSGNNWEMHMGDGAYTSSATFIDQGDDQAVFKFSEYKLQIWVDGR